MTFFRYLILMALAAITPVLSGQTPGATSTMNFGRDNGSVAVLGTFHFGSTGDVAGVKIDSLMGAQRQKEIVSMLEKIQDYQPTKILVEVVEKKQDSIQAKYQEYLEGDFTLKRSEIHQLGFRLAKIMNHDSVYAIDYELPLPFSQIEEYADDNAMLIRFKTFVANLKAYAEVKSTYLESHTLTDYYLRLNSDSSDRWNRSLYLQETLDYNHDTDYTGPKIAAMYYERNLYITANVMRHAGPDERLLLIIGSGHRAIMKHFFKTRYDIDYVEINHFLSQ